MKPAFVAARPLLVPACLAACIGTPTASIASPLDRSLLPTDPAIVVHVDVDALRDSEIGKFVWDNREQLKVSGLDGLKSFGIDPMRDIHGVTLVMPRDKPDEGVVVLQTTAAVDKLWEHLKTEPNAHAMSTGGYDLWSWEDGGDRKYGLLRKGKDEDHRVAFVSGDWDALISELKTADGKAPAMEAAGAPTQSKGSLALVDMRQVPADMRKPGDLPGQALFGSLRGGSLELGEDAGQIFAKAILNYESPQVAQDMQRVGDGLLAMARLIGNDSPELGPIAAVAAAVKIQANEDRVSVTAGIPVEQAKSFIRSVESHKHRENGHHEKPKNSPDGEKP